MKNFAMNSKGVRHLALLAILLTVWLIPLQGWAHCDSYDGPVIKDAQIGLETGDVSPILKWVQPEYEEEITRLFQKTLEYKNDDKEVFELLEKHFLETLVRIHREGEGAPYTGLKPAGSTKPIVQMTDTALNDDAIEPLLLALKGHITEVVAEKFDKAARLRKQKDDSSEAGRKYVAAYVDYTHTIEALHDILEHSNGSHSH